MICCTWLMNGFSLKLFFSFSFTSLFHCTFSFRQHLRTQKRARHESNWWELRIEPWIKFRTSRVFTFLCLKKNYIWWFCLSQLTTQEKHIIISAFMRTIGLNIIIINENNIDLSVYIEWSSFFPIYWFASVKKSEIHTRTHLQTFLFPYFTIDCFFFVLRKNIFLKNDADGVRAL